MSDTAYQPIPRAADYVEDPTLPRLNLGLRPMVLLLLLAILGGVFLLSISLGSVSIPFDQIITVLAGGEAERRSWTNIVLKFRLPKATTAALAGSALGVSGLLMQTFFRNPLAGPFVLGISSGASLGVALVVLSAGTVGGALLAGVGLTGDLLLAGAAGIGAGATMLLVLLAASRVQSSMTLLILGLMLG
ncbi:MAG: iron chelate uptake ABC transporter family permease subunit, partial [Anaerolineales bacterium]